MKVILKLLVVSITIPAYILGFVWASIETWFKIEYEDNLDI